MGTSMQMTKDPSHPSLAGGMTQDPQPPYPGWWHDPGPPVTLAWLVACRQDPP